MVILAALYCSLHSNAKSHKLRRTYSVGSTQSSLLSFSHIFTDCHLSWQYKYPHLFMLTVYSTMMICGDSSWSSEIRRLSIFGWFGGWCGANDSLMAIVRYSDAENGIAHLNSIWNIGKNNGYLDVNDFLFIYTRRVWFEHKESIQHCFAGVKKSIWGRYSL